MNFGEYFKLLRTEHNMTQRDIAARLGVTRQAISHWENNKNLPDLEMLVQIADTFDLSLDQLLVNSNVTNFNDCPFPSDSSFPYPGDTTTPDINTKQSGINTPSMTQTHHHHRHYTHKEIQRLKLNLLTFCIGAILLFFGVGYVGVDNGMERRIKIVTIICKSYILVPLGFLFILLSIIAFILFELKHLAHNIHRRAALKKTDNMDSNHNPPAVSDAVITQTTDASENREHTPSDLSDHPSGGPAENS